MSKDWLTNARLNFSIAKLNFRNAKLNFSSAKLSFSSAICVIRIRKGLAAVGQNKKKVLKRRAALRVWHAFLM